MVSHPPNMHTQAAARYQPIQDQADESANTHKVTACLTYSECFNLPTKTRALLPPAHKTMDLQRKQLYTGRLHLAMGF